MLSKTLAPFLTFFLLSHNYWILVDQNTLKMRDKVNEELILKALIKGNKKAFDQLYATYYEPLCRYLLNYTRDYSKIEDVVQETFIRLWNKRKTLTIQTSPKSYLYRTAYNQLMDNFRTKKRRDSFLDDYYHTVLIRIDNNQSDDLKHEQLALLKKCLEELPDRCRMVFMESRFTKKTNQEIANEFGLALKTVEGHISKGYRLLKECMKKLL